MMFLPRFNFKNPSQNEKSLKSLFLEHGLNEFNQSLYTFDICVSASY